MATATNKNYLVIGGNGEELKTVKTLAAAKKLADADGGSVLVDGECVYRAAVEPVEPTVEETVEAPVEVEETQPEDAPVEQPEGDAAVVEEQTAEEVDDQPEDEVEDVVEEPVDADQPARYRLKTLMNIRKEPSTSARKVGTAKQDTIVEVKEVRKDWLHLTDGTFILYGGGEFAEKIG